MSAAGMHGGRVTTEGLCTLYLLDSEGYSASTKQAEMRDVVIASRVLASVRRVSER
jgi:hypothetical protein